MIIQMGKHAVTTLLAIVIVGALLCGGLAVRLSMGPIPMTWAVPYIEQAMQSEGGIPSELAISDLSLAWNADANHIEFAAQHVMVTQQGATLTAVDHVGMTFSVLALLRGQLRLKDLVLTAPHFQFALTADSHAGNSTTLAQNKNFLSHLHSVVIQGGTFDFQHADTDVHDVISQVNLKWKRNLWSSAGDLAAKLQLGSGAAASPVHVSLKQDRKNIRLSVEAQNIMPADLEFILDHVSPGLLPPSLPLEHWQMATSIHADIILSPDGKLQQINGNVMADKGQLIVPELYGAALPLGNLQIRGGYDAMRGDWQIDNLSATILDSDGDIPLGIAVDGNTALHTIHVDAGIRDIKVSQLKRWWPKGAAAGAIEWLGINLKDGKIPRLQAAVDLHAADGANYTVARASGSFDLQNISTTFLPGFPTITGINGKAAVDQNTMHIDIVSGQLGYINLLLSTLDISDLAGDTQTLKLHIQDTGQLPTVLKLLDTPPYAYIKKMGLDATTASGGIGADIKMEFPLLADLKISDIKYRAVANLSGVSLPHALMNRDITEGQGVLEIDPDHMKITGRADVAAVPIEFTWQDFLQNVRCKDCDVTRRIVFSSELLDDDHARLGLPTAGRVQGTTKLTGTYETHGPEGSQLHAQMDFHDALFHADELAYQKPAGAEMTVTTDMTIGDQTVFKLNAVGKNLTVTGSGILDGAMNPLKLDFPVVKAGDKTDAAIGFEQHGIQQHWTVNGNMMDASGLITSASSEKTTAAAVLTHAIQIKLGTLYLANQGSLKNVQGDLDYNGQHWDRVNLRGDLHAGAPLSVNWDANSTARKLTVRTPDAGALLSGFDITTAMIGGDLSVDGTGDPPNSNWLAHGKILIKNFRMREISLLGRLIATVSPGEILDKLRGRDGVGFDSLDTAFDDSDDILRLRDGKLHGQSLGLTFEGDINQGVSPATLKIKGTFVPLYAVNNALANIPVIGDILNGKNGSGLVGFNYTASGPVADANVSVNPLSALAPGFLRDLFF